MARITDPDDLTQSTEVIFNTSTKKIGLRKTGNLSDDGVTLKALYSFCKEEWKNDATLIKFPFPFTPITDESFEIKDGWDFDSNGSRFLIRTAGWSVLDSSGPTTQIWSGVVGLGTVNALDQVYYDGGAGATDIQLDGQVNQAILVYSDPNADGNVSDGFDRRSNLGVFIREQGRTFAQSNLDAIGVEQLAPQAYRFPLSTLTDTKVADSDGVISSTAPYSGMSITYYAAPQSRSIGDSDYNFGIVIDGNDGTAEQIYSFVQYQLRQDSDINDGAGVVVGKTADELVQFVGDTLRTRSATNAAGGGTGVYIDNFRTADTNRMEFTNNVGARITFPFVAVTTIQFNQNLINDSDAIYRVFFTNAGGNQFNTANAIIVNNNSGTPVSGTISGQSSIQFDFDYEGNTQGGRIPNTDAAVTVVAIGLSTGQYVSATGTITRSTANSITLVAPLERNYANP